MSTFPWEDVLPVISGTFFLSLLGVVGFDMLTQRAFRATPVRGMRLSTGPLLGHEDPLTWEEGPRPWGWVRHDGDLRVLWVDPYHRAPTRMRLSTPLQLRAVVDPAQDEVRYHGAWGPTVALGLVLFPLSLLIVYGLASAHRGIIEDQLRQGIG